MAPGSVLQSACMNKRLVWIGSILVLIALLGLGGIWLSGRQSAASSRLVTIYIDDVQAAATFISKETTPRGLIEASGLTLLDSARVTINGIPIALDDTLPEADGVVLQIHPAHTLTLTSDGETRKLTSAAPTLGQALAEAGINLRTSDHIVPPTGTPLTGDLEAILTHSKELTVTIGSTTTKTWVVGKTVGDALVSAGLSLQGLDYSIPGEDSPLPSNGNIQVVRVREQIALEQTNLPYGTDQISDDSLALGESQVIQAGVPGVKVSQVRIRYEDGLEVSRSVEGEWVAREPVNQKIASGTKMELRSAIVDGIELQYWHSMTVYATSYSPCNLGVPGLCGYTTASGAPAGYGSIGVIRSWFNVLVGTRIYVPGYGYGTINDIGAGIPGKDWIDLGFSDAEYVEWHHNVTIYFLPPAPASVPWVLQ